MESFADYKSALASRFRRRDTPQGNSRPRAVETLTASDGPHGTTIFAVRDRETFTMGINDAHDNQIGILPGIDNVPHGLMLAEGYVQGYYAGIRAGRKRMYGDLCAVLGVTPDPQTLATMDKPAENP